MEKAKGLIVYVLRNTLLGDCTNNGVTSKHDRVLLVGDGIPEIFEDNGNMPVLKLVYNDSIDYYHAKPYEYEENEENEITSKWYMMGGNFVYASDSRLREITKYPIPVHDRVEAE